MSSGPWRPDDTGRSSRPERSGRSVHTVRRLSPRALETDEDRKRLFGRVQMLEVGVLAVGVLLLLGFWQLQLVHGSYYAVKAEANQLRQSRIRPARGLILDRNGTVLATNRPSYEVGILREAVRDEDRLLRWLAKVLGIDLDTLRARLDKQRRLPRFVPVIVASDVPQRMVVAIEARRREHPGIIVQVTPQRYYPRGSTAAHVLGYVGEITRKQLQDWGGWFRMGDIVGQQGLEAQYNRELAGQPGSRLAVVDSQGREIEILEQDAPMPGKTLVLTLDAKLQERTEQLLRGQRGAIVVIDTTTGGVLALASSPTFDPNAFAARFSAEDWHALLQDPAKPLQDRAVQASLPPGSVFKLVMATAGLEEGVITPETQYFCPGGKEYYGRFFRCLGVHGNVNVIEAIAHSCNVFFYELGVRLGRERIVKWAERLGLGHDTGIDLPSEDSGIVPSDAWLARTGRRYYPGETVSLAIGQGPLAVSPLQLASMASIVATGLVRTPHLLFRLEEPSSGRGSRTLTPEVLPARFRESTRRTVLQGMRGSVQYGSSRRARLRPVAVGGKTGTAQVASASNIAGDEKDRPERLRNHAWFVAVAPLDNPEIALAVFLEHGGSGGRAAAPLGGQVLASYFGVPANEVGYQEIPVQPTPPAREPVPTEGR